MLTSTELDQLRADALLTLPDTCAILRPSATTDADGDSTSTWETAAASVACRLDPFHWRDWHGLVAEREVNRTYYVLTLPYDANLRDGDRVVVADQPLEVMQLFDRQSARIVVRAYVARISA
jgi:hypothetical protein